MTGAGIVNNMRGRAENFIEKNVKLDEHGNIKISMPQQ